MIHRLDTDNENCRNIPIMSFSEKLALTFENYVKSGEKLELIALSKWQEKKSRKHVCASPEIRPEL